jgi:hypothetical protein
VNDVNFMFRIDIGFSPTRGYAASILDVIDNKTKGVKGNSIRQLMRQVHEAVAEEEQRKRRFPLEHEASSAPSIITPDNGDPLFGAIP